MKSKHEDEQLIEVDVRGKTGPGSAGHLCDIDQTIYLLKLHAWDGHVRLDYSHDQYHMRMRHGPDEVLVMDSPNLRDIAIHTWMLVQQREAAGYRQPVAALP